MYLRVVSTSFVLGMLCLGQALGQSNLGAIAQISLEQGLSDRRIKDITRDKYGYIWIATRNGLNRYNGLDIISYDRHPHSTNRISSKDIQRIVCRDDGSLIIQYEGYRRFLDVLPPTSTQAQKIFLNHENGIVSQQIERLVGVESSGSYYVLLRKDSSLVVQELNDIGRFDSLFTVQGYLAKPSSRYHLLMQDRGLVWISDDKMGLILADTNGNIQAQFSYDSIGVSHLAGLPSIFYQDQLGRVWLSFENARGLWEFNEAAGYFTPFSLDVTPSYYKNIWEDDGGNVIIAAEQEGETTALFMILADDSVRTLDELLAQTKVINRIYSSDFERILFVGTNGGVQKVTLTKKRVQQFLEKSGNDLSQCIRGMVEIPDGNIVMQSEDNHWYSLSHNRDSVHRIEFDLRGREKADFSHSTRNLVYDHQGKVWGTRFSEEYWGELISYDFASGGFASYAFPLQIQCLLYSQDSLLWFVSGGIDEENRLTSFDPTTKTFDHYFKPDGSNPLKGYETTYLFESSDGTKWIGTTSGVLTIDRNEEVEKHVFSENDYYGLSSNYIYSINEDSEQRVWIGTDAGVNVYDPHAPDEEFSYYDTKDGLADNNVCAIEEDRNGNMWFTTFNGLSYFDISLQSFRNFGKADGFSQTEFNTFACLKDAAGDLILGGRNGVNYFNPNELLERNLDAPILLSELSYYDKIEGAIIEHVHNLQEIREIELPASNRYFQCKFALADYAYPDLNQYQYMLEGLDREWNWLGAQNEIRLNNLPAGLYTLMIKGADRNLNVSENVFAMQIKVNQFFYRKSWFVILCVSLLLFSIYLFHRVKVRQVINMERLRTKISSDLHDDVGGLLSGLAMQTELLQYTASDRDKPKLRRISEMSRNAMAQMRDVIWATDARKDRFEDLLIRMKEYASEILFSGDITFDFDIKGIVLEKKLPVPVRQNLYLIFKEAITNVAKHSNGTHVNVLMKKEGHVFELVVKDNGTIVKEKEVKSSLNGAGLKNMKMRAENINADLNIKKEGGFKVTVSMKAFA